MDSKLYLEQLRETFDNTLCICICISLAPYVHVHVITPFNKYKWYMYTSTPFRYKYMCTCTCIHVLSTLIITIDPLYSEYSSMDLDNSQGKQLLRVLLNFAMTKQSSLSLHALKLIFRHFSQREEMVEGFTEV